MAYIFQDNQGNVTNLTGKSIEQIICIDGIDRHYIFTDILLLWLKLVQEECWYRIFFDAGYCFCSVYHSSKFTDNYK